MRNHCEYEEPLASKEVAEALNHDMIANAIIYDGQDTLAFAPPFCVTKFEVEKKISIIDTFMKRLKVVFNNLDKLMLNFNELSKSCPINNKVE